MKTRPPCSSDNLILLALQLSCINSCRLQTSHANYCSNDSTLFDCDLLQCCLVEMVLHVCISLSNLPKCAGSGQSPLPHQTCSASTGQPDQAQRSGPAQPPGAARQQPQYQPKVRSSPLYAESEGEDSETESSAGGSVAADEAEQQQQHQRVQSAQQQPVVTEQRPSRASGQASRAVSKPPTSRAQGRGLPAGPVRKTEALEGRRRTAPIDNDDEAEGFGLISEDEQEPARKAKAGRPKPDSKAQVVTPLAHPITTSKRMLHAWMKCDATVWC